MTGAWNDFNDAPDQTRPKPEERLTSDDLKERLHGRLREVLFHLLPNGKIRNGKFVVGDVHGNKGDSLSIELSGAKIGMWHDFATGDGGDILSLWGAVHDRIVVEIGYRSRNTVTTSRTGTLWYGGNGSDLAGGGGSASGIGYIDFSDTFALSDAAAMRVTQLAVEAIRKPIAPVMRVSQLAVETVRRAASPNLRMSQVAVEVIRKNGSPVSASGQGGMLIVVAG